MTLLSLVITLIVVGVLLWVVNRFIPMDGKIKQILNIVVVIGVILYLLNAFGVFRTGRISSAQVPQLGSCSVTAAGIID